MSDRKQLVREFYENRFEEEGCGIDGFEYFMPDKRIGRVELVTTGDWGEYGCEADFDSVEIEQISTTSPPEVIEAFDRHIWFSQQSLTNIFAFKITVKGHDTYAIGISGIAGDGYDNAGHFAEIFDESGELLGAASIGEGEKPNWLDRPVNGADFNTGALEWSARLNPSIAFNKVWSEELAVRIEQDGGITRMVMIAPE
ncbi:MAG: hypothetical protein ACRCZS_19785 [Chroococcidiopsis sp.]